MTRNTSNLKRRSFLKKVVQVFSAIGVVAAMVLYLLYVFPKKRGKRKIVYVDACATDDLPDRGVKHFFVGYPFHGRTVTKKIFIVNTETAEPYALSGVCTHLGCLVRWDRRAHRFQCPCHQGQYNLSGAVVAGPPPAPLQRMTLKIDNDRVLVGLKV
jgi:cytochrome b6-f complex iron-sulfur subunit